MSNIVAIGDIHGDYNKLMDVMNKLATKITFETTPIVFIGDYVDGGRDTMRVVNSMMQWQKQFSHWVFLKGNHEDMLLDAVVGGSKKYHDINQWWGQGGRETFLSYVPTYAVGDWFYGDKRDLRDGIGDEHLNWMQSLALDHESQSYYFVHAGYRPHVKLSKQSEQDKLWIRGEFFNNEFDFGKPVVFGHTCFAKPVVTSQRIAIDTMHHGHGRLTSVILNEETKEHEFVQSFETT